MILVQRDAAQLQRADVDEVDARVDLAGAGRAAQELGELAGARRRRLGHVDLDAVGALEQELDRGHGLDRHAPHLTVDREVVADAPLGEPRQHELAADERGGEQSEEGERRAEHPR